MEGRWGIDSEREYRERWREREREMEGDRETERQRDRSICRRKHCVYLRSSRERGKDGKRGKEERYQASNTHRNLKGPKFKLDDSMCSTYLLQVQKTHKMALNVKNQPIHQSWIPHIAQSVKDAA